MSDVTYVKADTAGDDFPCPVFRSPQPRNAADTPDLSKIHPVPFRIAKAAALGSAKRRSDGVKAEVGDVPLGVNAMG